VERKENHLLSREAQMQELEDKIFQLKQRIRELTGKKFSFNISKHRYGASKSD
jgi:hypothetical protein